MRVLGIHPIEAREPVHLVEIEAQLGDMPIDWSAITQPIEGRDRSYWQAPYDERKVPNYNWRWCFFFHFLDRSRPLSTGLGELTLPPETPVPEHLHFCRYEEP